MEESEVDAAATQVVERAFEAHSVGLERRLAVFTRDQAAGQDLAQEAFYRLARQLERGPAPDDIGAWLHRVGRNLAVSRGRHLQVADRFARTLAPPDDVASPERIVLETERQTAMRLCLTQLTRTEQRAIALAAHGLAGRDMASAMGRTPSATRTLLCRARSKLRRRLMQASWT